MSAAWSRAARRAIWRIWERVAAVVAWVEGELVARRTLPGAGGEEEGMLGLWKRRELGNGRVVRWGDYNIGCGVREDVQTLETALSVEI